MKRIKLHDLEFETYIPEEQIITAIKGIADKLNDRFEGCDTPPIFVTILSGAFMFSSELMRHINFDVDIAFTAISSYSGVERGEICCKLDLKMDVAGRDVVLLDEIIDSGKTAAYLVNKYKSEGAKSVGVATLIYKSTTANSELEVEYQGIDMVDDKFIVGYGLDYNESGRALRDIYILAKDDE